MSWTCNAAGTGEINGDANNFAPRFGVALDVFGNGNTVLRGGGGMYFSQMPTSYQTQLMYNRPIALDTVNPQVTYGQPFGIIGKERCIPFPAARHIRKLDCIREIAEFASV